MTFQTARLADTTSYLATIPVDWSAALAVGNNARARHWTNKPFDLEGLIRGLKDHHEGPKDGLAFLQGATRNDKRKAEDMQRLDIIGIDVDDGTPSEDLNCLVKAKGLFCVRYTTHSHTPEHHKNRLVFVLARPWVRADYASQREAETAWKTAYEAFCGFLGVRYDASCTDVSRLFYLPRHAKDALSDTKVHQGGAVDIFALPKVAAKVEAKPHRLKSWAAKHGNTFLVCDAIRDHADDRIRDTKGDKLEIECPFEHEHSTPGGTACFALNAGESSSGGFVISCRHAHCADRDRLDFLAEMVRAEWLEESVLTGADYNLELEETAGGKDGRPILVVNHFDHSEMIVTVRDALMAANAETPRLFRYAENLARLIPDADGRESIGTLGMEEMREEIRRNVHCRRHSTSIAREVEPPNELVRPMLVKGAVPFPVLEGVVRTPVFGPGGTINTTPGYDEPSHLFYDPNRLAVPTVSAVPDAGEVKRARELLMTEVLEDFPFDGPDKGASEKAHTLAMFLQPFARAMIDGPTPIYLIVKPTPGTGASKLVNVWGLVCHGEEISSSTETGTEDEMRKRLTASVLEGKPVFYLDNLNRKLEGSALASAVTSGKWTDRRLGASETIEAKIRHTWIVTGNNPTMSNEITRRCMRIRLDAKVERPEERKGFRHADLEGWVMANRGELVWACLTLIQNWVAQGKPAGQSIGSFERWSRVMGGILDCAGVKGFLKNTAELRKGADEEGDAIRTMLAVWWTEHDSTRVKMGGNAGLHNSLADHDALPSEIAGERDTAKRAAALGRYVAKLDSRIFTVQPNDGSDEIQVRVTRDTDSGGSGNWKLVKVVRKEAD